MHNMHVAVSTDSNIKGGDDLSHRIETTLDSSLGRFEDRLTRIEVHLSDQNADKTLGDDKRCVLEARPRGMQAIAVSHQAPNVDEAVRGAARKMVSALGTAFGRRDDTRGRPPTRGRD
jgi:hypothetical protein